MWKLRPGFCFISLLLLCSLAASVDARGRRRKWLTLSGNQPLVIARGGFSGLFADSSYYAYALALLYAPRSYYHVWCDVKPTKDGFGICFPDINLQNASNINIVYPKRNNSYPVNGHQIDGYFSVDFTLEELSYVNLQQGIYSRAPYFDGTPMPIFSVDEVVRLQPPGLWLNIANDAFFTQQNLSMRDSVISLSRDRRVNYISSPEVHFLQSIVSRIGPQTKLVFQFLGIDDVEASTKQKYGSLQQNLTFIKTFASGILVPKSYIWKVYNSYLSEPTTLVQVAHKSDLEVFASDFVNDFPLPYNYSYDPVNEYLKFIDNGIFSVDGVLSDFPLTPSATIDCFSQMGRNDAIQKNVSIISLEGASVDYPGCTDLSYKKAVNDGVDIIDCPVQVTNDRIAFCFGNINLKEGTNALRTALIARETKNDDLNISEGIFAYNVSWNEIQTMLRPSISSPYSNYNIFRNPSMRNEGSFLNLSDFLSIPNNASSVSGIIIGIEHAAYLAEKQGLAVIDLVLDALSKAGYDNQTAKKVMIKSSDSAVLKVFKSRSKYELVYVIDEDVRDILNDTISEIKEFATAVVISKQSVFPTEVGLITGVTAVVSKLQDFKLKVYVQTFRNEFVSQSWDCLSDPYVELDTHLFYANIDGVITDFPATANRFRRNRCLGYKVKPNYMQPIVPGNLMQFVSTSSMPPAEPPNPVWTESDVAEAPLPPVLSRSPPPLENGNGSTSTPRIESSEGQLQLLVNIFFSVIAIICSAVLL